MPSSETRAAFEAEMRKEPVRPEGGTGKCAGGAEANATVKQPQRRSRTVIVTGPRTFADRAELSADSSRSGSHAEPGRDAFT